MKIIDILHDSIVDGPGLRTVIFFAGCKHMCKGCHNPESWNEFCGYEYSGEEVIKEIKSNKLTRGVTFSGGDPFFQTKEISKLAEKLKEDKYNIWIYSGFTFEEIIKDEEMKSLLSLCDVLVDGRFEEELKDLTIQFRGSTNQRIIDIQKSLNEGKVVLYNN